MMKRLSYMALCGAVMLALGGVGQASDAAPSTAPQAGAQVAVAPVADGGYHFQLFLPRSYRADGQESYPLLIFLHGSGERGDDINAVKVHGPPKIADQNPDFPFILISPQLPAEEDWDLAKLDAIVDQVSATYAVDPSRVYLTGLSLGGIAAWRWAAEEPKRFAAVAPVAGDGDPATACAIKDIPIWAFHGDRDDVVVPEGSFFMQRAIRACGGSARLTIYPNWGHNAWDPAYDDPALYYWMLSQRR